MENVTKPTLDQNQKIPTEAKKIDLVAQEKVSSSPLRGSKNIISLFFVTLFLVGGFVLALLVQKAFF